MIINILASGSGGNCISIRSGQTTLLIDAGIAKTKIEKKLLEVGIRPDSIAAIFVTHAHGDHIYGLPFANKYRIPVFASEGEWKSISKVDDGLKRIVKAREGIDFANRFYVEAFNIHHNSFEPLGYAINDYEGNKCSVCLDTGHVDDEMLAAMEYSCTYIIEANHEPNMVETSSYPPSVKARILGSLGHLSNQQTAEALSKLIQGLGERIYLTHLSSSNNMPALAEMTVKRMLAKKGFKANKDFNLEVIT